MQGILRECKGLINLLPWRRAFSVANHCTTVIEDTILLRFDLHYEGMEGSCWSRGQFPAF
jgi:hypothetical protein